MFERLPHKRISEDIVDEIVSKIRTGSLKVGEKLPPERVLADELGVSRTSLREAMRTLENMGYIRSVVGGGNYVNAISIEHILSPFSALIAQDKTLAADIIQVRQYMEVHMAFLAAKKATKEQISRIYGAVLDMEAEIEEGGSGIIGDNAFHLEIAKTSQNKGFILITELLYELLSESRMATLAIPGQPEKTIDDHMAIFEAIKSGDPKAAQVAMKEHLEKAYENLRLANENGEEGNND
ncbi:MAG: FadR family transcriptional regulator [Lachnospiraceae bacterium]|nr:FadR family transcriptional regulator [Lachnospiraceae bacterium]